ncbi:MAG TPA: serpin family protein [Candidatus Limnocylindrales bacterium]|nr:serpin family protein [Candidatus Limnocylindrales bacterium]
MKRPLTALLALALVAGCSSSGPTPSGVPGGPGSPGVSTAPGPGSIELAAVTAPRLTSSADDAAAAGSAVNAFGLDLYASLVAADPAANLVFSPASIATALAMARAGAKGQTAAEMDAVMRDLGSDANAAWVAALDLAMNTKTATVKDAAGDDQEVVLRSVNAPFGQRGYLLEDAYLRALAERFDAGLRLLDFAGDTEGSRGAINGWVSDQTEDRIPELLAQGTIDDATRLVLVNAIYLKAAWNNAFAEDATKPAPFTGLDGTTTDVAMMHVAAGFPYAAGPGWQAIDLGYVGGRLAMTVIVPDDLAAFEKTLDAGSLASITGALHDEEVQLAFPKFGTETQVGLGDVLKAMGMPTAFDPGAADFSGMTLEESLFIGAVIHQANIDVDEEGTEAAAATAIIMRASSAADPAEPVKLTVDRPFIFALRDLDTGAVLFLGRITMPEVRTTR